MTRNTMGSTSAEGAEVAPMEEDYEVRRCVHSFGIHTRELVGTTD